MPMSNTNGRLFRLGDMLGRSSHYSGNRRSFGTLSAPSTSIAGVQAVLVVSVVASGALEETDISGDASGFVAAATFAPMRFDATRTGSSSDGTSHLLVVTKREHSRFD